MNTDIFEMRAKKSTGAIINYRPIAPSPPQKKKSDQTSILAEKGKYSKAAKLIQQNYEIFKLTYQNPKQQNRCRQNCRHKA